MQNISDQQTPMKLRGSILGFAASSLVVCAYIYLGYRLVGIVSERRRERESVHWPSMLSDLQKIIADARRSGHKIRLVDAESTRDRQGVGRSSTIKVRLDLMSSVTIDPDKMVAVVRGNARFTDLEDEANRHSLAVRVRQPWGASGVLASISANVHGLDCRDGCIGNTVSSVTVLDQDAELQTFTPGTDGYKQTVGGFGSVYLIYEAEIQLAKNVVLRRVCTRFDSLDDALWKFRSSLDAAHLGVIRVGRKHFYTVMHYPVSRVGTKSAVLATKRNRGPWTERLMADASRLMVWAGMKGILDRLRGEAEAGWKKKKVKLRNEVVSVPVSAMQRKYKGIFTTHQFRTVEYFVEERHLGGLMALYREQYKSTLVLSVSITYVKAYKETHAQYARTDVLAVAICWSQSMTSEGVRRSRERNDVFLEYLRRNGGTFCLAHGNRTSDIAKFYPEFVSMVRSNETIFTSRVIEQVRNCQQQGSGAV